jgi:phage tail sheath protein FI
MVFRDYKSPGVFLNDVASVSKVTGESPIIAAFIGVAATGPVGQAVLVTSWQEYVDTFARGLSTPFIATSHLGYAVYAYFQNGGRRCYIIRVVGAAAAKATATLETADTAVVKAKYEGEWANDMTLAVVANGSVYDFTVRIGGVVVEKMAGLSFTSTDDNYWCQQMNDGSKFITVQTVGTITADDAIAFSGGASDLASLTDTSYVGNTSGTKGAINALDDISDASLIAIPGQTSTTLQGLLLTYCEGRGSMFAILDPAESATADNAITARGSQDSIAGAMYYPWVKVVNPLSAKKALRNCPPSGHVAGLISRFIAQKGAWRAPAGTEAILYGVEDLVNTITNVEMDKLNAANVNCIIALPNYGVVVWGARNLTKDTSPIYVSDSILNYYLKRNVYALALPFVFEGNNARTRLRLQTAIEAFMDNLWKNGAFKGDVKSDAYFVKCDDSNNTAATMEEGKLICDIGYAGTTPAEFVVFQISYNIQN